MFKLGNLDHVVFGHLQNSQKADDFFLFILKFAQAMTETVFSMFQLVQNPFPHSSKREGLFGDLMSHKISEYANETTK